MSSEDNEGNLTSEEPLKDVETSTTDDDDEPDEWDKRIITTGCAAENTKLTDCYWEKKDWRKCQEEMKQFQDCWKKQGNAQRTDMKNV